MKIEKLKKSLKDKLLFIVIFTILGFIALQIPFNKIAGSNVSFTLFDLFAPISGAFLGSIWGVVAVFLMQGANLIFQGFDSLEKASFIRLFPTLFAVLYFVLAAKAKGSNKLVLLVPMISFIAFNLHPIGRTAWIFSLYWFIPLLVWPLRKKFLFARALGATFTAHSVGGAIWIWVFNLPTAVWLSLIPIVALERGIFALGISASYVLTNNILAFLTSKKLIPSGLSFDKRFLFKDV